MDQLDLIFKLCGMPTEEIWPGCSKLPFFNMITTKGSKRCLREAYKHWPEDALDLVDKLLTLDPSKRISAAEALDAEWFWKEPLPCKPSDIPAFQSASCHEFEAKKRRNDPKRFKGPGGQQLPHHNSNMYPPPPSNYTNGSKRSYGEMTSMGNRNNNNGPNWQPRPSHPPHNNYPPNSGPPPNRPNLPPGQRPPYHGNPNAGR
eukprot:TRINITY_DN3120_c0_g1_i3.p1 TRINITY_DN3120_c0_g1~~TRINITY_DN3120_c0_g1_i3.p1  ORF type:complete len:203 (+),score=44.15 TRINITY_DN3120_c0_g1_i3:1019-1627(+)